MKFLELTPDMSLELRPRLCAFESLFYYPLGEKQQFRIDHSPDYTAFYRAIGDAKTLVVLSGNDVIASISIAIRNVSINGSHNKIAYIGDLKIHTAYQAGRILFRIAQYVQNLLDGMVSTAYSVVMDGTKATPEHYTGRIGIPLFRAVTKYQILRLQTFDYQSSLSPENMSGKEYALYSQLREVAFEFSSSTLRSALKSQWFASQGRACGMLEDTRMAKRLYLETGEELLSAHLSYFAFDDANAAVEVIMNALGCAYQQRYPYMFIALSESDWHALAPLLKDFHYTIAQATVYATDNTCARLPINTAEI